MTEDPTRRPRPISALLARRLAAAASGFPHGRTVWFRARYEPDAKGSFQVSPPILSDTRPADPDDPQFGIFGPYQTPAPSQARKRADVVQVTLHLSDGRTIEIAAGDADCLFWSAAAIEKFAVPYYAAVGTLETAVRIREDFNRENVVAMDHGPNTEYTMRTVEGTTLTV